MKRFLISTILYCLFSMLLVSLPIVSRAQVDPACDPGCNCACAGYIDASGNCVGTVYTCPIDNGVYILLLLGVGYGIKKVRDSRKTASAVIV